MLPRSALEDLFRGRPPGTVSLYTEYYDMAAALRPAVSDFRHSVTMLRELAAEKATGEAIAQGMEILRHGAQGDQGEELRGHEDARAHVMARFAVIEREQESHTSPEGDIRRDTAKVHKAYAVAQEARAAGRSVRVSTGLAQLDGCLSGGFGNGELGLVAGWTSAGKSQLMAHLAWHACVMQHRNVVLFASETTRDNMSVRILGRHSRQPAFGLPHGLNTRDIRAGALGRNEAGTDEYQVFRSVLDDFGSGDYGRCHIIQLPRGATMGVVESRLLAVSRQFMPDLVIIDYLGLIRPERARKDRREELAPVLMDAKQLAVTFGDGRGVPVLSPWQVNREGRKSALERKGYTLSDLAETAEASNTPDVIISLLEPDSDDSQGRKVPLRLDILKNRENERHVRLELAADFANSYFSIRDDSADEGLLSLAREDE